MLAQGDVTLSGAKPTPVKQPGGWGTGYMLKAYDEVPRLTSWRGTNMTLLPEPFSLL